MHRDLFLIPLLSIPMVYQLWLLWQEYMTGFTPEVYYRPEPVTDLPGITVCLPIKYAFREAFILNRINQSTDPGNHCTQYKKYINQDAAQLPDRTTDPLGWREMHLKRMMCYNSYFLDAYKTDPIHVQNITQPPARAHESRWMLIPDDAFMSLVIEGNTDSDARSDAWPKEERSWRVRPNMKYTNGLDMCWTWFSRATHDWIEAAHGHVVLSEGQESSLWTQSEASQRTRNEGVIVSGDHPGVWPYRLDGVHRLFLEIRFLQFLKRWYSVTRAATMKEIIKREATLREGNPPLIRLMTHSPYDCVEPSQSWLTTVNDYLKLAEEAIDRQDLIISTDWTIYYTKTTLQHLSAPQYSQYINQPPGQDGTPSGYSNSECRHLLKLIDNIKNRVTQYPRKPVCIHLMDLPLTTYDWMPDLQLCGAIAGNLTEEEVKLENEHILQIFEGKRPLSCPTDGQRIMFKMTAQETTPKRRSSAFGGSHLVYAVTLWLEHIPEMTIRYVYKMATIELLANGCGLCGIWIGFSFLWLISQIIDLVTMDCAKQRFEALKRILKPRHRRTFRRPANLSQHQVQVIHYSHQHKPRTVHINHQPVTRVTFN